MNKWNYPEWQVSASIAKAVFIAVQSNEILNFGKFRSDDESRTLLVMMSG